MTKTTIKEIEEQIEKKAISFVESKGVDVNTSLGDSLVDEVANHIRGSIFDWIYDGKYDRSLDECLTRKIWRLDK